MKPCALTPLFALLTVLAAAATASAQAFDNLRIGDRDGFGYGDGAGLLNFEGNPVNVDGVGLLGPGPVFADFLPDLDQDGLVQDFRGDDFDNRSASEVAGASLAGVGYVDNGSTGSQFTDVTLSRSFDTTFPLPNDFPDPPSINRNDARFQYRFFVATGDISAGIPIYLNVVFGDIGAIAGEVRVTFASAAQVIEPIAPINPNIEDGLIRAAFVELSFADVFTATAGGWNGQVDVDLVTRPGTADGDPFYAIDYAELSTARITGVGDVSTRGSGSLRVVPSVFGGSTRLQFELRGAGFGRIDVYDVRGARLRSFSVVGPTGSVLWDGRNRRGLPVAAGVYFVRLQSRGLVTTQRAVFVR